MVNRSERYATDGNQGSIEASTVLLDVVDVVFYRLFLVHCAETEMSVIDPDGLENILRAAWKPNSFSGVSLELCETSNVPLWVDLQSRGVFFVPFPPCLFPPSSCRE